MEEKKFDVKNRKVLKKVLIVIFSIFICVAIVLTFFTLFYLNGTNSKSNYVNVKAYAPKNNENVNILVTGVTARGNQSKETNSIVLFHYEPQTKKLKVVSVPRDSLIKVDGKNQKLRTANSVDGPKFIVSSVQNLMNIKVNYYVQLDYDSFKNIMNSLGPVEVNVNSNMNYDDSAQKLHINLQKGPQQLNAEKAEEYYRWVKNNDGKGLADGDLGRIKNDQQYIESAMSKAGRLSTIVKYPSIISSISKNIESNMTTNEVIKYARLFSHVNKSNVSFVTASGIDLTIDGEDKYYIMNNSKNAEILNNSKESKYTSYEASLKVDVLNGTEKNGFAKECKTVLNDRGFKTVTTGNAPKKPVDATKVTFYGLDQSKIAQIKDDMGSSVNSNDYELVNEKSSKYDVVVVLGNDKKN
ncbi:MAG: LCP family protein [Clostridium sp.]|nr:LCP family protein [Clostridium sp.]